MTDLCFSSNQGLAVNISKNINSFDLMPYLNIPRNRLFSRKLRKVLMCVQYSCIQKCKGRILIRLYSGGDSREIELVPTGSHSARGNRAVLVHFYDQIDRLDIVNQDEAGAGLVFYRIWIVSKFKASEYFQDYSQAASYFGLSEVGYQSRCAKFTERCAEEMSAIVKKAAISGSVGQDSIDPFVVDMGHLLFPFLIGNANSFYWYVMERKHHENLDFYKQQCGVSPGETIFDCGCHTGYHSRYLYELTEQNGRIFAFDAFEQNNYLTALNAEFSFANGIIVPGGGVGRKTMMIEGKNENQMISGVSDGSTDSPLKEIQIFALDEFIKEKPDFIKIDVEGYEYETLMGAQKILREIKPRIFIELHPQFLGNFKASYKDILRAFPVGLYKLTFIPNVKIDPALYGDADGSYLELKGDFSCNSWPLALPFERVADTQLPGCLYATPV